MCCWKLHPAGGVLPFPVKAQPIQWSRGWWVAGMGVCCHQQSRRVPGTFPFVRGIFHCIHIPTSAMRVHNTVCTRNFSSWFYFPKIFRSKKLFMFVLGQKNLFLCSYMQRPGSLHSYPNIKQYLRMWMTLNVTTLANLRKKFTQQQRNQYSLKKLHSQSSHGIRPPGNWIHMSLII